MKATISGVVEDPKFKITEGSDPILVVAFWNLNLRSSNTKETVDFTPPWYKKFLENAESANVYLVKKGFLFI